MTDIFLREVSSGGDITLYDPETAATTVPVRRFVFSAPAPRTARRRRAFVSGATLALHGGQCDAVWTPWELTADGQDEISLFILLR